MENFKPKTTEQNAEEKEKDKYAIFYSIFLYIKKLQEKRKKKKAVREYKDKKFETLSRSDASHGFDHDSPYH